MSKLLEHRNTQLEIQQLQDKLAQLENDEELKREIEFSERLEALMSDYGMNLRNIIAIIDPHYVSDDHKVAARPGVKKPRRMKVYVNPHTSESLETKGGNNTVLKGWKSQYGNDEVEKWASYKE